MGLFDSWFGKQPQPHTATVTLAAAEAVRRFADMHEIRPADASLVIGASSGAGFPLDLSENLSLRTDPQNAVAVSHGITIIMPRALVQKLADLVIDFESGGFLLIGSACPRGYASHPANVEISLERLYKLSPLLQRGDYGFEAAAFTLSKGDSRAAVVVGLNPLIVAAYTDEICAVALLRFPEWLVAEHKLQIGARLLTANTYQPGSSLASDLIRGEGAEFRYCNFSPLIADFLGANAVRIEQRKREISETEWALAMRLGQEAMTRARGRFRDGCPPNSDKPAF
jgi:hypothetical protein